MVNFQVDANLSEQAAQFVHAFNGNPICPSWRRSALGRFPVRVVAQNLRVALAVPLPGKFRQSLGILAAPQRRVHRSTIRVFLSPFPIDLGSAWLAIVRLLSGVELLNRLGFLATGTGFHRRGIAVKYSVPPLVMPRGMLAGRALAFCTEDSDDARHSMASMINRLVPGSGAPSCRPSRP